MRKTTTTIAAGAVLAALALPASASAHVTVQPDEVPAGGFTRMDVRVPNESEKAATNKVEVQMPDGFIFASYEPVEGWSTEVEFEKTEAPVEAYGEEYTEQVDTITWTADSAEAGIEPGQFRDFGLSVGVPEDAAPGDELAFPAIQTYDDGEVVRWIGDPDSDLPAATVAVTEPEEGHGGSHATAEETSEESGSAEEASASAGDDDGSGGSNSLAIAGLAFGVVGFGVGGLALSRTRRS